MSSRGVMGCGLAIALGVSLPIAWIMTQTNTAIAQVPGGRTLSAVSLLHVNAAGGSDTAGNGSERAPFQTITQALRVAPPNTVILLAPGTYSPQTGEQFPLQLKPGVSIQGEPHLKGQNVVIRGGGTFLSPTFAGQNVTILAANQSGLTGVTVTNPNPRGYGLWIESSSPVVIDNTFTGSVHDGISVAGNSAPIIRNNTFVQNGANGITIYGTSQPEVRDNLFENTGFGINVGQNAAPLLIGNRITQNQDGIVLQAKSQPILRGNWIEANKRDGIVAIAQARPDLGTAAEPGNNIIRQNGRLDINTEASSQVIPAFGNQVASARTKGRIDLAGSASVAVAPPALAVPTPPLSPSVSIPPVSAHSSGTISAASFPVPAALNQRSTPLSSTPALALPAPAALPTPPVQAPVTASRAIGWASNTPGTLLSVQTAPPATATTHSGLSIPVAPPAPSAGISIPVSAPAATRSGISIPVPPPASATRPTPPPPLPNPVVGNPPPAQVASARFPLPQPNQPIEIPVPPPLSSGRSPVPPSAPPRPVPLPPAPAGAGTAALPSGSLLPVPRAEIPLGNTGNRGTSVVVARNLSQGAGSPPPPPSRATILGLRYRVVVAATTPNQQAQVRSLVPGAFRSMSRGQIVMQAGAFDEPTKADEVLQLLSSHGFNATLEQLD